jgi:hypothetical protein
MIINKAEVKTDNFGSKVSFEGMIDGDFVNPPIGITQEQFYNDLGKELVKQVKALLEEK